MIRKEKVKDKKLDTLIVLEFQQILNMKGESKHSLENR